MSDFIRLRRRHRLLMACTLALAVVALWGWLRPTRSVIGQIKPPANAQEVDALRERLGSANRAERLRLIHALGQAPCVRSLEALKEALRSAHNARLRRAVITQIGRLGTPEALDELVQIALGSFRGEQHLAIAALGEAGGELAVEHLLALLEDSSLRRWRANVLTALGMAGTERARDVLIDLSQAGPLAERISAISALGEMGDPEAFDALRTLAGAEEHRRVRWAAVSALGELGTPKAKAALLKLAEDDDLHLRASVLQSLGRYPEPDVLQLLSRQTEHADETLALAAANALASVDPALNAPRLITALRSPHANVRNTAAYALAQTNLPEARDQLIEMLADRQSATTAVWALHQMAASDDRARAALLSTLKTSTDVQVRQAALQALSDAPPKALSPLLEDLVRNGHSQLASTAIGALAENTDPETVDFLLAQLEDGGRTVRSAALNALTSSERPQAQALIRRLALEGNVQAQHNAIQGLQSDLGAEANATLSKLTESGDANIRARAAAILARRGDTQARQALLEQLRRGEYHAAWELGRLPDPGVKDELYAMLSDKTLLPSARQHIANVLANDGTTEQLTAMAAQADATVAASALSALGNRGGKEASAALTHALASDDLGRRSAALSGLQAIGSAEAIEAIGTALGDDGTFQQASSILAARGGKQAMSLLTSRFGTANAEQRQAIVRAIPIDAGSHGRRLLERALDDPSADVVAAAARTLGQLGDRRLTPRLVGLMQSSDNPRIRRAIAESIRSSGGPTYERHKGLIDATLSDA